MNLRGNKGITLIALVITIIVLLILAGITISTITGGDGAVDKASEAIRNGNYSGNADAQNIKENLKDLVKDTSMITGTGPWQITGAKTGTKYVITEENELISFPTYEQKEYIKSTGTQYIDTGVVPANTVDFEITFKTDVDSMTVVGGNSTFSNKNVFWGAQNNDIKRTICFNFGAGKGEKYIYIWKNNLYGNGAAIKRFATTTYNPKNQITISCINNVWKVNNNQVTISDSVGDWQDINNSLYVFGYSLIQNQVKTIYPFYENMYLYSLKIWNNGELVRDFIPVVESGYKNEPCLYDLVTGYFYYNSGTGTFETN